MSGWKVSASTSQRPRLSDLRRPLNFQGHRSGDDRWPFAFSRHGKGYSEMTILQTMRLTLTPCRPEDRADFIGLERDPEVMRFLNGGYAVDRETEGPEATFLMPTGTEPYIWTARHTANGAFVGWFCLWPEGERLAELGYRLRRMDWGQGSPRRARWLLSTGALKAVSTTRSRQRRWPSTSDHGASWKRSA
jgi:hypothetical protein